jgi:hypothetical protein
MKHEQLRLEQLNQELSTADANLQAAKETRAREEYQHSLNVGRWLEEVNYPTLMLRIQKRASQFIGNCRQNSVALLVLHCLQGQKSWFPRPILFLATCTYELGFRLRQ